MSGKEEGGDGHNRPPEEKDGRITEGGMKILLRLRQDDEEVQEDPVTVRVLKIRKLAEKRFRLTISDGTEQAAFCMYPVVDTPIIKNSIIRVDKYNYSEPLGKRVLLILKATLLSNIEQEQPPQEQQQEQKQEQPAQQQQIADITASPIVAGDPNITVVPIYHIVPYMGKGMGIKGRCSAKSAIKPFRNRPGRFFTCNFGDSSAEVKMIFFNENADNHFNSIQQGKVYFVQNFDVQPSKPEYNYLRLKSEMVAYASTKITEASPQASIGVPLISYNFSKISAILSLTFNQEHYVDAIGICTEWKLKERRLNLKDYSTNSQISFKIPDEHFEHLRSFEKRNPVILIRNARVEHFNQETFLTFNPILSDLRVNPQEVPEFETLNEWKSSLCVFDSPPKPSTSRAAIKMNMGLQQQQQQQQRPLKPPATPVKEQQKKPFNFSDRVQITDLKKDCVLFKQCPIENCTKELHEYNGLYWCSNCNSQVPTFEYKIKLQIQLCDDLGQMIWVTCCKDTAEKLLDKSEEQCVNMLNDFPEELFALFNSLKNKYFFVQCEEVMLSVGGVDIESHNLIDIIPTD